MQKTTISCQKQQKVENIQLKNVLLLHHILLFNNQKNIKMQNLKTIGTKITDARKKLNYSQADLANLLAISPQAVGKWERGESSPDIVTFIKIAEVLQVDLNYFSSQPKSEEIAPEKSEAKEKPSVLPNSKRKLEWNMSEGNWEDSDFSGLKNLKEKFSASNMKNCRFIGSDLSGLELKANNIELCDFSNSLMSKCSIQSSKLSKNNYEKCSLNESIFAKNNLEECNFMESNLTASSFESSNITVNNFIQSDLSGAEFSKCNIERSKFSKANLTGSMFSQSNLCENNFEETTWKLTSFFQTSFYNTTFTGKIEDCSFDNCSFSKVTFQNATILFTFFKGKKFKGIKFIDCQTDQITYDFLKNGKADLTGLRVISE